jgi:hypothetical protein
MTFKNLMVCLAAYQRRRPFVPFQIQFMTGESVRIGHPEAIRPYGQAFRLVKANNRTRLFDAQSVCQVLDMPAEPAPGASS